MIEALTQTQADDYIAETSDFMQSVRGVRLDGVDAFGEVNELAFAKRDLASDILESDPAPNGYYVSLSEKNASRFDEAVSALVNHFVLVPGKYLDRQTGFYLAVVSADSPRRANLRLHVLGFPYGGSLTFGTKQLLSGAGQLELASSGVHGRLASDSLEAEHFQTLTAISATGDNLANWKAGKHVNHLWRQQLKNSVVAESMRLAVGQEIAPRTLTFSRDQFETGQAMILWHNEIVDDRTGLPAIANEQNGLILVQSLGYRALKSIPDAEDNLRELIS